MDEKMILQDKIAEIQQFLNQCINGELTPLATALENTAFISDGDFESVVMRYAHGDCFQLSGMMLKLDISKKLKPYCLFSTVGCCHSLVGIELEDGTSLFLDANGLQTKESVKDQWKFVTGFNVDFVSYEYDRYMKNVHLDDDELTDTIFNFSEWISFVKDNNVFLNPNLKAS